VASLTDSPCPDEIRRFKTGLPGLDNSFFAAFAKCAPGDSSLTTVTAILARRRDTLNSSHMHHERSNIALRAMAANAFRRPAFHHATPIIKACDLILSPIVTLPLTLVPALHLQVPQLQMLSSSIPIHSNRDACQT